MRLSGNIPPSFLIVPDAWLTLFSKYWKSLAVELNLSKNKWWFLSRQESIRSKTTLCTRHNDHPRWPPCPWPVALSLFFSPWLLLGTPRDLSPSPKHYHLSTTNKWQHQIRILHPNRDNQNYLLHYNYSWEFNLLFYK